MKHQKTAAPDATAPILRIDNPQVAVSGILNAMLHLSDKVTVQQQRSLLSELSTAFRLDRREARDLAVLGNWVASQSATPDCAIRDLSETLSRMSQSDAQTTHAHLDRMAQVLFGSEALEIRARIGRMVDPHTA